MSQQETVPEGLSIKGNEQDPIQARAYAIEQMKQEIMRTVVVEVCTRHNWDPYGSGERVSAGHAEKRKQAEIQREVDIECRKRYIAAGLDK